MHTMAESDTNRAGDSAPHSPKRHASSAVSTKLRPVTMTCSPPCSNPCDGFSAATVGGT